MSNQIDIHEEVLELTPEVFRALKNTDIYKLTKTEDTRKLGFVLSGDSVMGPVSIVNVIGKPGVKVFNTYSASDLAPTYIRTSPVVAVLDVTDTTITFRTEGGVYKLEKV
jgi:hypothetical protein